MPENLRGDFCRPPTQTVALVRRLRLGVIIYNHFIANFLLSVSVKEFRKSVNI